MNQQLHIESHINPLLFSNYIYKRNKSVGVTIPNVGYTKFFRLAGSDLEGS